MSAPFVGKRVIVDGTSRADLNGQKGIAESYSRESFRYNVKLDSGSTVALKGANLLEASEQPPAGSTGSAPSSPSSGSVLEPGQNRMVTALLVGMVGWWLMQQFSGGSGESGGLWGSDDDVEYDDSDTSFLKGQVREVATLEQFKGCLAQHSDNTGLPVVVDFFSHSCGPCRMIAPAFKRIAKEYAGRAVFLKVDVNRNYGAASACNIRGMPTFQFYLNKKQVFQFSGADERSLHQYTASIVDRAAEAGIFVGKFVSPAALSAFYKAHDPEKVKDVDALAQKYEQKTALLMRVCRQKYASLPDVTTRERFDSDGTHKEEKQSKSKTISCKDLHSCPTENLLAELERRREEESNQDVDEIFDPIEIVTNSTLQVAIVGGGPAGLAAAIYAARAGLRPVVLAPAFGGQLLGKGVDVENYPGVIGEHATGRGLVEIMRRQAKSFEARFVAAPVLRADFSLHPFQLWLNGTEDPVQAQAVILACGADPRWLRVDGEDEYRGRGVSACATCDGWLFRDREVTVVGGGDTAMEDALHLARSSKRVTVLHRRDAFRASKVLAENVLKHPAIDVRWNTTVSSFHGDRQELTHLTIRNIDGRTDTIKTAGAFVAIGHDPQTAFLQSQVDMDNAGYIKLRPGSTMTSVAGVFAAGDVADHTYRQAVTASGTGAQAALDAERWLTHLLAS